ncbi:class I SAM-dependent methyltransferase [Halalkalibacillus halophilus]|uniref:class I SAM-dependent methyltransferase n=1 Tax=Halalkalibacillus halophilus TaxID=392827 RepID=UPI000420A9AA|nr:methyltransferase domain-containing protein [Halalkalibacillus halophilus]
MKPLYDKIGGTYDTTRKADPEITRRLREHLQLADKSKVLDVACGTGNYTIAMEKTGLSMSASDLSQEMINKAELKTSNVEWKVADVSNLPYPSGVFDGVTCTLSIHHFENLLTPFKEVYRVLSKGRFVIFTSTPEQMNNYWLNEYFPIALKESAEQMPALSVVNDQLKEAGFDIVGAETFIIQPNLQDFFLYSGKYDPRMYLDEHVRAGISTFANLASEKEISQGCEKLKQDIESGHIENVMRNYSSHLGDYAYVVAEKK